MEAAKQRMPWEVEIWGFTVWGLGFRVQGLGFTVWCLVGKGGMDYGDEYWGLHRGYYRDPFPTKHQTV